MIAENKTEFFEELERELQRLGVEDTSELIADLEEHFAEGERRGLSEGEVCRELGSIREIARSCLDIKSSAINSMVAHEATRKKAVSLTKPGRDIPADPSLAKPSPAEPLEKLQEDAVRSFTPEHIAEEVIPGGVTSGGSSQGGSVGSSQTNDSQSAGTGSSQGNNSQSTTAGSSQDSSSQSTSAGNSQEASGTGVFERIGKKVDAACDKAGQAINDAFGKAEDALKKKSPFSPSDSYRGNINDDKHGEIPKQEKKIKTKDASKFVDLSQLTPNVKPGRLVFEIILDMLLWIWLVPTVIVASLAMFVAAAGIVFGGVAMLLGLWSDFARYFLPTRILFALGFFALASFVACLASVLVKPAFALPKCVVRRHIRAIYDV